MSMQPRDRRPGDFLPLSGAFALLGLLALLGMAAGPSPAHAERSVDGEEELLPIGPTPEEAALEALFVRRSVGSDPPPTAPIRNVAEFERCTGALIRYPLGIPYSLIHEMTEEVKVHVIVDQANHANAMANFTANGINPAQVEWVIAPSNSIWTRDYGPWFVFDGNGDQVILDHYYNRPFRPLDNVIPSVLGQLWGIPVVTHDLWHAGGNYMTDGLHLSYSSDLVWNENQGMTHPQIAQFMLDYYGVETYNVLPDIALGGIHHIDTWGKLLDEETVLMKQVATNHVDYARIEANAITIAGLTNQYGRPFRVVRIFCPNIPTGNVASYTNSLILNNKVLVPVFNLPQDAAALQVYRDNMPGYEVLPFNHAGWITDDALHCRVMNIFDRFLLRVDHNPVTEGIAGQPVPISVYIDDRSEAGLDMAQTRLHWRVSGQPTYNAVPLLPEPDPDWFVASIPAQNAGTQVEYYVTARDLTGRTSSRPRPAPLAAHRFTFEGQSAIGDAEAPELGLVLSAPSPNPFNPATTIRFSLPEAAPVRLSVWDVSGREVARLVDRTLAPGQHAVEWNGRAAGDRPAASGVYVVLLETPDARRTQRAVLMK
jgi:agmatine deiminase